MQVRDLIGALCKFDPDLPVTVGGVDFVVLHERTGGYDGHVPPRLTRWLDINPPETLEPIPTKVLESMRAKFRGSPA